MARRILGIPVDLPSANSSSLRNSPIRRLRWRRLTACPFLRSSMRIDRSAPGNLKDGASVKRFLEWFPGVEEWQVEAVIDHEIRALVASTRS